MTCTKQTGVCAQLRGPQYIGCTSRPAKTRFSEHLGSATQQSQINTQKPVGVHFREAGHSHIDMVFLPIERVHTRDQFVLEARESYWIKQYKSVKNKPVSQIEHGLNLISYGVYPNCYLHLVFKIFGHYAWALLYSVLQLYCNQSYKNDTTTYQLFVYLMLSLFVYQSCDPNLSIIAISDLIMMILFIEIYCLHWTCFSMCD